MRGPLKGFSNFVQSGEVRRVLRPGGRFTFTEYTAGPVGDPIYPLPWAREPSISFLIPCDEMLSTLERAVNYLRIPLNTL